ncbi:hypothetical protein AVEN_56227-1 [Araneus ventricosus]|uniref:Uncharacterized protein n=1 Tax=Araneus ventricosus TaxID=182803 RepID=A0A4Y2J0V2_ARAVE|nr:hypothetical protein AVEN_56227-1 [Araneus ventricosus]
MWMLELGFERPRMSSWPTRIWIQVGTIFYRSLITSPLNSTKSDIYHPEAISNLLGHQGFVNKPKWKISLFWVIYFSFKLSSRSVLNIFGEVRYAVWNVTINKFDAIYYEDGDTKNPSTCRATTHSWPRYLFGQKCIGKTSVRSRKIPLESPLRKYLPSNMVLDLALKSIMLAWSAFERSVSVVTLAISRTFGHYGEYEVTRLKDTGVVVGYAANFQEVRAFEEECSGKNSGRT